MVIGMDLGTTVTAVLATVGGSAAMRQTGIAHVVYNVLTACIAFFMLDPFFALLDQWHDVGRTGGAQIALVAFHSAFNAVGVLSVLPFTAAFAGLITRLVPERGPPLVQWLDRRLLRDPGAAVDAATAGVREITGELFAIIVGLLDPRLREGVDDERVDAVARAIVQTREFLEEVRTTPEQPGVHARHVALLHIIDHLTRLTHRCGQRQRIVDQDRDRRLSRLGRLLATRLSRLRGLKELERQEADWDRLRALLRRQRHSFRERLIADATGAAAGSRRSLRALDSIRWLHRTAYHVWRVVHHLRRIESGGGVGGGPGEAELDIIEE
jgi:phosphate:Na+ symporter